jgi:hypothetical protein
MLTFLDQTLRPPSFKCEIKHFENIEMTTPGKSFSVPDDSLYGSDVDVLDDISCSDKGLDIRRSMSYKSKSISPPPHDVTDDEGHGINMLCAAAYSDEEPQFGAEVAPLDTDVFAEEPLQPLGWPGSANLQRKRKLSEAELDLPETVVQPELETEVQPGPATEVLSEPAAELQPKSEMIVQPESNLGSSEERPTEPPKKRSRIGVSWGLACFLAGSVGTVATLASLPDGYFA